MLQHGCDWAQAWTEDCRCRGQQPPAFASLLCTKLPFQNQSSVFNTPKSLPNLLYYPPSHLLSLRRQELQHSHGGKPMWKRQWNCPGFFHSPGWAKSWKPANLGSFNLSTSIFILKWSHWLCWGSLELRRGRYYGLTQTAQRRLNIIKALTTNVGLGFNLPKKSPS